MSKSTTVQRFSFQLVVAALVIALIALGVAVWALIGARSAATAESVTSSQPAGDKAADKTEVCDAFNLVRDAVSIQTNTNLGTDPVALHAVAANARLATLSGGQFLASKVNDGLPADLADAVRSFADDLEYVGMSQLAGQRGDDAGQTNRMNDAQAAANRVTELCK